MLLLSARINCFDHYQYSMLPLINTPLKGLPLRIYRIDIAKPLHKVVYIRPLGFLTRMPSKK